MGRLRRPGPMDDRVGTGNVARRSSRAMSAAIRSAPKEQLAARLRRLS
jgi:hypothetical protein